MKLCFILISFLSIIYKQIILEELYSFSPIFINFHTQDCILVWYYISSCRGKKTKKSQLVFLFTQYYKIYIYITLQIFSIIGPKILYNIMFNFLTFLIVNQFKLISIIQIFIIPFETIFIKP